MGLARFVLLVSAAASSAWATSFYVRPFPEQVETAPTIVRGRIGKTYVDYGKTPESAKRIYTYTEVEVEESIKGQAGTGLLTLRTLGGEKDGINMRIEGSAHFAKGEESVIFLSEPHSDNSYDVRGMMMGKFSLERDRDGKAYLSGPALVASEDEAGVAKPTERWTLEKLRDLARRVRPTPSPTVSPSRSGVLPAPAPHVLGRLGNTDDAPNAMLESTGSSSFWQYWEKKIAILLTLLGVFWWLARGRGRR